MSEKMKKITISMSEKLYNEIKENAKKNIRSVSEYIRLLLERSDQSDQ